MRNLYSLKTLGMTAFLLSCAIVSTLLSGIAISTAQASESGLEKASKRVIKELVSGNPQELIVVFNDKAARQEAEEFQAMTGLSSRHSQVIAKKAAHFDRTKQQVLSAFASHETTELKHFSHLPVGFLRIHSKAALDKLLANPYVVGVYENTVERMALAESLPLIGQPQAAAQGDLGSGTAVAVLDTGVDYTRSAFGSCTSPGVPANCKVIFAQDFAPSDGKLDNDGHGTNVAAIVLGVAPDTKIVALDVFSGSDNTGDLLASGSDILAAINWVIANKATYNIVAMNLSLGSGKSSSPVTSGLYNSAVSQARAAGVLTIAASGNNGYTNALSSLAATDGVISVGAVYDSAMGTLNWGLPSRCTDSTSSADRVTCFSNSTSFLTLLAPGSEILAAGITMSGTSQASPHVAGAVAVLRAAFPNETVDQTITRLTSGVMVTDSRNDIVKPRLNLPTALRLNVNTCTYSISETSKSFSSLSSSGSVAVATDDGCSWSAASSTSDSSWITVTSGSSGSGNGTINYSLSTNFDIASRTGTITIAGQIYTIIQSGSVGTLSNILLNSGFEDGPVSWVDNSVSAYPVITSNLNPTAATNSWYAWLCGYNDCVDNLYQDVTVPADAQSAYVQFNYWITSDESSYTAYDSMDVRVYSPPNASTYTSWTLTNLNSKSDWSLSPKYDVSAFKGQTIRLQFSATTDSSFTTSFYVDDVNLMVSGSTPDTQAPTVPAGLTSSVISSSMVNLAWNASTDNIGVTAYKIYRNGALFVGVGKVTSYSNTGLTAGTSYSYTVSACDAAGNCSAQSTTTTAATPLAVSDVQAPTVPTGLTATAISTSTINLAWVASTDNIGVSKYNVYRNGTLLTVLGNINSYSNVGLTPSTTYSYTVSACDISGNCSDQSTAVLATTPAPTLWSSVFISGQSAYQVTGNTVNITIDKITNNSYGGHSGSLRIELWALAAPYYGGSVTGYVTATIRTNLITGITDTLAGNSSFTNISLNLPYTAPPANKTSRALFLLEYDPVDCSAIDHFCIVDYRNFNETQSPTVPTGLSATATSSSKISLDWAASTDNVGVTTYRVYRNGTLVTLLGNVTSYLDSGLVGSTLNSYAVSACDAAGNCSAQSSTASATTLAPPDTQPPTVPSGLSATVIDSTHINLTWTASTDNVGVTSYKIFSGGSLVSTLGNVTSSFRSNNPSTTYSYTVSACDAADNCSSQSAPVLATTPAALDTQPPTVPTGLTATTVSSSKINLSWNASTDNIGVTAYKINSSDGQTATVGNVTNYSHTGLRSLTEYDYTIVACDAAGNCSLPSASVSSTTTDNPVNGVCGTANGGTFTAIPTANLCSSIGTASTVSGTGPWSWICNGSYGGTSSTCSAMLAVPPVIQFTVTPATGSGYSIFPVIPQVVNNTATTSFTITPASGYGIASVSGCGGSLSGTAYMTGPIIANCTISVIAVARNATSGGTAQAPTIFDALKVLQAVVGVTPLTQTEKIIYDVAPLGDSGSPVGNGIIDAADVILILRRSIGIGEW